MKSIPPAATGAMLLMEPPRAFTPFTAYLEIADADTTHETASHRAKEWVRGEVHTNSVEGIWSLFNRGIVGSYHRARAKHLQAYIDEFELRFNGRDNPELFRDTMIRLPKTPKMEFKDLIEKSG
jgi:hypothetical protein